MEDAARHELTKLVELLEDEECRYLLSLVSDTAAGLRVWEGDAGILYDEYVKLRKFRLRRDAAGGAIVAGPPRSHEFEVIPVSKVYEGAGRLCLPTAFSPMPPLDAVLLRRRSRRDYSGTPLTLEALSAMLYFGAGVPGYTEGYGYGRLALRTFPSHGGLQSPELYVYVSNVSGIRPGLYHYVPPVHELEVLGQDDMSGVLAEIAFGEQHVTAAAVVFVCTGVYSRLKWKYGERSYRFMCIDSGCLLENLQLAAEALGLGACGLSGFAQDAVEEFLHLERGQEVPMWLMTLGNLAPEN